VLATVTAAYVAAFLASRILERSSRRLPKTYDLDTEDDCRSACARMKASKEPAFWLGVFLLALGIGLVAVGDGAGRIRLASALGMGIVVTGISAWTWWRTTGTFMQFLSDFRRWTPQK
jgi:hypothetical protein